MANKANIAAIAERERAKNRYGSHPGDTYWHSSYEEIVKDFGAEVVDTETLGSYQGDLLFLLRDGERFGFLVVGYGSCSGCDSLEAAGEDVEKVQALADDLFNGIHWEPTAAAMVEYLRQRDPANDFWYERDGEGGAAVERFITKLNAS